jgi:hypothetical protein
MTMLIRTLVLPLVLLTWLPAVYGQAQPQTLNDWLNQELQAKINQRSNSKQTETPSQSSNSTTLVDQSSATDLISAALNLTGINQNSGNNSTPQSVSVTASVYSVYALVERQDPLDNIFYNAHPGWRRVFVTLGQDNGSTTTTPPTPRATIAGIKLLLWDKRDLSKQNFSQQFGALQAATLAFGEISGEIALYLIQNPRVQQQIVATEWSNFLDQKLTQATTAADSQRIQNLRSTPLSQLFDSNTRNWTKEELQYYAQFQNSHLLGTFPQLLTVIGDSGISDIRQIISRRIDVFPSLDRSIREKIEEIRRAPQFSVSFTSTTRPDPGANEYVAEGIFDYGVAKRINLTLNDTFTYKDAKAAGGISRGSKFVGDFQFQLTQEKRLSGRGPVTFDTAVEGDWMTKTNPTYKGQLKVKIPLTDGIDLPVSVTFASRTDLINEKDVIGKFGFTFDTAKLFSFLTK